MSNVLTMGKLFEGMVSRSGINGNQISVYLSMLAFFLTGTWNLAILLCSTPGL
jgi:hypothetical protein